MNYKTEIDGLRAIAVVSVVLFHAFPAWLQGGFIGVDVFFVISGFLITTHIYERLDKHTFSFTDFFSRRIKRIFPALILVMVTSLAFGWFTLLPDEYAQLSKHIASGAGFVTNFVLEEENGYFDNAAETKPMLHLWSLAVEEQFYIVWPLVLWFVFKRRYNVLVVTAIVALLSFYLNLHFVESKPTKVFFWPISRFWELLMGSLLAWGCLYQKNALTTLMKRVGISGSLLANVLSSAGLLLLVYGVINIHQGLPFPSTWALVPVMGAVLVIAAGSKAWTNRLLLMNPVAVWFGLISYPLYLWHWPVLTFLRILHGESDSVYRPLAAVSVSVLLAWLTYRFVESPVRFGKFDQKFKVWALLSLMLLVAGTSLGFYLSDGVKPRAVAIFDVDDFDNLAPRLRLERPKEFAAEQNVYVWGDSYADALTYPLKDALANSPLGMIGYIRHSCPSLLSTLRNQPATRGKDDGKRCQAFNQSALAKIRAAEPGAFIVLTSSYAWYDTARNQQGHSILVGQDGITDEVVVSSLRKTTETLIEMGLKPIVVMAYPTFSEQAIRAAMKHSEPARVATSTEKAMEMNTKIRQGLSDLEVYLVDPVPIVCGDTVEEGTCYAYREPSHKWFVWKDGDHLSYYGGSLIAEHIRTYLENHSAWR